MDAETLIDDVVAKIVAGYAPQKIILFGSYAYGAPRRDSDIDLLIIKDTPQRFLDRYVAVQRLVAGRTMMVGVETLVLTPREVERRLAVGDQFIAEIVDRGQVLYDVQRVAVP